MGKEILLITRYFPPLDSIATIRMLSWAKGLVARGHRVTVLTTTKTKQIVVPFEVDLSPYKVIEVDYFDPLVTFGGEKKRVLAKRKPGIKSWAVNFYRSRLNERMPGRTDGWILPAIKELHRQKKQDAHYDVIISSYGPPSAHIVGARAKAIFGSKWIADYRDLWVENATYKGLFPFTFLERFLEKCSVRQADAITTISDPYRDFLQKKFPESPCSTITNGFDAQRIDEVIGGLFDEQPKKLRIVYTGALYKQTRDPSPLFQAVRELIDEGKIKTNEIELLFYGSVADALPDLIAHYNLQEVARHCGSVSQQEAYRIQKSSDVLLFLEDPSPAVPGVLTGKLFEYLYIDVPILAIGVGSDSSAGSLIEEAGAGVVCGQNVSAIEQVLLEWMHKGTRCKRNRDVVASYSRENHAKELAELVEQL